MLKSLEEAFCRFRLEQEYKNWPAEAGFEQIERGKMPNGDGVIAAKKSA
jgi:hypothetical protein